MRFFDLNDPDNIEKVLPEKAYRMVKAIRDKEIEDEESKEDLSTADINPVDKIKELTRLKNEGIISKREFKEKKKKILDKMVE